MGWSMMPKSRHGFLGDIMLYLAEIDHVHAFSSIRAKGIVIERLRFPRPGCSRG